MQSIKVRHVYNKTENQISYFCNIVYFFQKKKIELVLFINFTRICFISVLFNRLNISITICFYSSVISQDLSNRISKYKILFQKKKIRSNNITTLLKIFCFLNNVDILEIILLYINLSYKFWNITDKIEKLIIFETEFYIDLLVYATELNNTIYFFAFYIFITITESSFQKRDFSVNKKLQLYIVQSMSNSNK